MSNTSTGRQQSQVMAKQLLAFLGPLEQWLDDQIDRRLVRTFFLAPKPSCAFATPGPGCS